MRPGINVVEKFIKGKQKQQDLCEDMYYISDDFVVVIDGSTNKSNEHIYGRSPGRFVAETLKNTVKGLEKNSTLDEILEKVNEKLLFAYNDLNLFEKFKKYPYTVPNASLVMYSKYYNEVWLIGDCQCLIDGALHQNSKQIDEVTSNARSMYVAAELNNGKTIGDLMVKDTGREFILPLIKKQYNFLNADTENPYSFGVVTGFPIKNEHIQTISVPNNTKHIVLASDGYPFLSTSLIDSEAKLENCLEKDPLCYKYFKSTKGLVKDNFSFDDRTYIKFKI